MSVRVIQKLFLILLVFGPLIVMSNCFGVPRTTAQNRSGDKGIQQSIDALGDSGGIVQLPCQTIYLRQTITIRHPVVLQGCGTSIGAPSNEFFNGFYIRAAFPGTRLVWIGGRGIGIDVGPQGHDFDARGTVLRDFNLENQGDGTIGIRINTNEPRVINVFVMSLGDEFPGKPFSTAGIVVGDDNGLVNDFLCRDCYVRFQEDGIQILGVSEATIDHSRFLENRGNNIVLGDPTHIANNIQIVNGTNFSSVRVSAGAGIKITRAANIVNVENGYCENDAGTLCIDATNIVGGDLNQLNIRDTYFAKGAPHPAYAIGLNAPSANVVITGNVFLGDSIAGVLNERAGALFTQSNLLLDGTPALVSSNTNVNH
jgi:hypothetical protein